MIQEVFYKLNIEACGPLSLTTDGNRYILAAMCMTSKYSEAIFFCRSKVVESDRDFNTVKRFKTVKYDFKYLGILLPKIKISLLFQYYKINITSKIVKTKIGVKYAIVKNIIFTL